MENRKKIMTKAELDEIFKSRNFYDTIKIENCKITDMNLSDYELHNPILKNVVLKNVPPIVEVEEVFRGRIIY